MPDRPVLSSEDDFLALIDRYFPTTHRRVPLMRGDDCAVLELPPRTCLTTDLFLEHAHFRRDYFTAGDIGWKGLAVNLSDIASMGATPLGFVLGLMIPEGLPHDFWADLFAAMAELAVLHDCPLVGGDLSRAPLLGLSVTAWGAPGSSGRFLTRAQCRPGDRLFVTGPVGLARAGLHLLERDGRAAIPDFPAATKAHLRPHINPTAGPALAAIPGVRGLMDLSDGLARDLPRFLGKTCGAALAVAESDLHPETVATARRFDTDPARWAVLGGEDYVLLGSCAPEAVDDVRRAVPQALVIGTVTEAPGLSLNYAPFAERGFDHFA